MTYSFFLIPRGGSESQKETDSMCKMNHFGGVTNVVFKRLWAGVFGKMGW